MPTEVVLLNHSFPPVIGGGQTYQYYLAKHLPRYGFSTDVITGELPNHYALDDVPKIEGEVYRIKGYKGFTEGVLGMSKFLPELSLRLLELDPRIIYVHGVMSEVAVTLIRNLLPKAKVAFIYHKTPIPEEGKHVGLFTDPKLDEAFARYVFEQGSYDLLVAQNNYYGEFAIKSGAPQAKIRTILLGVDTEIFNPSATPLGPLIHSEDRQFICLPVRFIKRKGIEESIKALALLPSRYELVLATSSDYTDQSYYERIKKLIWETQTNERVHVFMNQFAFQDMAGVYRACDIRPNRG